MEIGDKQLFDGIVVLGLLDACCRTRTVRMGFEHPFKPTPQNTK